MYKFGLSIVSLSALVFASGAYAYDPVPDPRLGDPKANTTKYEKLKPSGRSKFFKAQSEQRDGKRTKQK